MIGRHEWSLLQSGSGKLQEGSGLVENNFLAKEQAGKVWEDEANKSLKPQQWGGKRANKGAGQGGYQGRAAERWDLATQEPLAND